MTTTSELLLDGFSRIQDTVHDAVDGLSEEQLCFRVDPEANTIAWLVWHLTRVQDDHIADAADVEQVYTAQDWAQRFDLPLGNTEIGYGHTADQVAAVRVSSPELLTGYYDAVHEQTVGFVRRLTDAGLGRIVDERWDPPVTLAVRLISVINDDLQHAGQAAFLRGIVERR